MGAPAFQHQVIKYAIDVNKRMYVQHSDPCMPEWVKASIVGKSYRSEEEQRPPRPMLALLLNLFYL